MKQQDVAMLILIVSISLMVSYFIGNSLFGGESNRTAEVEKVVKINQEFPQPSEDIFNEDAINLTPTIEIGDTSTTDPFSSDD